MASNILQPTTTGKDAELSYANQSTNYGTTPSMNLDADNVRTLRHALVEFDLTGLSLTPAEVVWAKLFLYQSGGEDAGGAELLGAYRVTAEWNELEATWLNRKTGIPWSTPGGDFVGTPEDTFDVPTGARATWQKRFWNLTELIKAWLAGTYANYGVMVRVHILPDAFHWFRVMSSENTSIYKPLLWIEDKASPIKLIPDAPGTYSGYTKSGFPEGWRNLLDVPGVEDNLTSLISTTLLNAQESWLVNAGVPAGFTIDEVAVSLHAQSGGSYLTTVKIGVRIGGIDYWHDTNGTRNSTTWQGILRTWATNPATGQPWMAAEVNGLECVVQHLTSGYLMRITRADVSVSYSGPLVSGSDADTWAVIQRRRRG